MNDESPDSRHARKAALIAGIAAGKTVIVAAAEAGIGWRRAYVWRAEDAAFRAAWDQARTQIRARIPAPLAVPPSPELPARTLPPARTRTGKRPITVIIEQFGDPRRADDDGGPDGASNQQSEAW